MADYLNELVVLYEITTFSFSGSEDELFRGLVSKTARLFGAGRAALMLSRRGSDQPLLCAWGFPDFGPGREEEVLQYLRENGAAPGVYVHGLGREGTLGTLF